MFVDVDARAQFYCAGPSARYGRLPAVDGRAGGAPGVREDRRGRREVCELPVFSELCF